jgi:PAP2 superfamily
MNTSDLPPWGVMEEAVVQLAAARPIPEAWRDYHRARPTPQAWEHWRNNLADQLSQVLWPKFDADFALLEELHGELDQPVRGIGDAPVNHRVFFQEEDGDIGFGAHYERYDPTIPQYILPDFTNMLWNGINHRIGSLHYQLKAQFQRPRPFQVAYIQKRDFHYVWAASGGTPSFISGHCVQSAVAGCSAFTQLNTSVDIVSIDVLKQFAVDIGDRRVFAGVHYPSDNLGSWITALHLLPHVFDAAVLRPVAQFLWEAITQKSIVFGAIQNHLATYGGNSAYAKAVALLHEAGRALEVADESVVAAPGAD